MSIQRLWLPGKFPSTNDLLDMKRREGAYRAEGKRRGRNVAPPISYTGEVARIRTHAWACSRAAKLARVVLGKLDFVLVGVGRFDPSAWYLSAKAVEDGLVDAGVLASDRYNVWGTSGRCLPGGEHARLGLEGFGVKVVGDPAGMLVSITEVGPSVF